MTIRQAVAYGEQSLAAWPDARLDAETLLADLLQKDRSWLWAHDGEPLNAGIAAHYQQRIERRLNREPLAYIVGHQPFYGRRFLVTPDVLIPRPESEMLVDAIKRDLESDADLTIVDVGTGSGCLAATIALELPQTKVIATDISPSALIIAKQNTRELKARVMFLHGNLVEPLLTNGIRADIIVANLPYLSQQDMNESPTAIELTHEPLSALFAADDGLALIKEFIRQSVKALQPQGHLYLELLPRQVESLTLWVKKQHLPFTIEHIPDLNGDIRFLRLTRLVEGA